MIHGPAKRPALAACLAVASAALFLSLGEASAQDLRIGFIDSDKIFQALTSTQEALQTFDREHRVWQEEAERMTREVEKLQEEIKNQSLMLSEARRREKLDQLETLVRERDAYVEKVWGADGDFAKRRDELYRPIEDKVMQVIQQIGDAKDYALIFDVATDRIVYVNSPEDLTAEVVDGLKALGP